MKCIWGGQSLNVTVNLEIISKEFLNQIYCWTNFWNFRTVFFMKVTVMLFRSGNKKIHCF